MPKDIESITIQISVVVNDRPTKPSGDNLYQAPAWVVQKVADATPSSHSPETIAKTLMARVEQAI